MKIGNLEVYGIIYKITNIINNKTYIGQTTDKRGFDGRYGGNGNNIERVYNYSLKRREQGKNYNTYLLRSIEKYGFKAFETIKIFDIAFSKEELDIKEDLWINYFDCINNGYNWKCGGANGKHSEETKKKISESKKGKTSPRCGIKLSDKTKLKISMSLKGTKSNENKHLISVICITTNKMFNSARDAGKYYDLCPSSITKCCRNKLKSCGRLLDGSKMVWKYYNE